MAERSLDGRGLGEEVELHSDDLRIDNTMLAQIHSGWGRRVVAVESAPELSCQPQHRGVLSPAKASADPAAKPDDAQGDSRTLWVDFDAQDRRYKSWTTVCDESCSEPFGLKEMQEQPLALCTSASACCGVGAILAGGTVSSEQVNMGGLLGIDQLCLGIIGCIEALDAPGGTCNWKV